MFGTLTLAATLALTPAQPGSLNLTNVRTTYGELGAPRTDNKYLPNDLFFVSFDIEGITVSPEGKVSYTMSMVVTDKAGKEVFKPDRPSEREEQLPLGGNKLPARAFVMLKPDQEPGTYTCKVTVTDRNSKATKTLEKPFDVVPKTFGIVFLYTSSDSEGNVPGSPNGVVSQNLFIQCALIGFGRGADKKPNSVVELRVLDEQRRPTLTKPISAAVPAEAPENDPVLFRFPIPFNREGNFTVELKAIDNVSSKTSVVSFPIKVSAR